MAFEVPEYVFLENKYDDSLEQSYVMIMSGPYAGVAYGYGSVSIKTGGFFTENKISFDYDIIKGKEIVKDENDFVNTIGNIIVDIFDRSLKDDGDMELKKK